MAKAPKTMADLGRRLERARAASAPKAVADGARRGLLAWFAAAERHGLGLREVLKRLASGDAARGVGHGVQEAIEANPPEVLRNAACRSGCAFCCILSGGDGGTMTEAEARTVHAALAPFAGVPDGRAWHPAACPALDPASRTCRIYEARPLVCRAYVSTDAAACEANSEGGEEPGGGLLGSHASYLAALALARDALRGTATVGTYALDRVAAATVEGADLRTALDAGRQKPRALDDALKGTGRAITATGRR